MPVIITTAWAKGVDGDWNTESDWTEGVPLQGGTALITVNGTYTVTSSQANSVGNLEMQKKATLAIDADTFDLKTGTGTGALDGTITLGDGTSLDLGADSTSPTFDNNGAINIIGSDPTSILISGNVTLNGKGKINLENDASQIVSDGSAAILTNSNTISGVGTIGDSHLTFVNAAKGVIDANNSDSPLVIDAASFTNYGLMEATKGAELGLEGEISQTGNGRITVAAGSTVASDNDGASIEGGAISTAKGSFFGALGGDMEVSTATPLKNAGMIESRNNVLTIVGSVKNSGTLYVDDTGVMTISGAVTGGTAQLDGGNIEFGGPSSAKVVFGQSGGASSTLILDQPTEFKGTIAGMTNSAMQLIDLEDMPWTDHPSTNLETKGKTLVLTVTDPVKNVTAVFKILAIGGGGESGGGSSMASDGSTLVYGFDGAAAVPSSVPLLVQSMASFAESGGVAASGSGNLSDHHQSSELLAAPHHG